MAMSGVLLFFIFSFSALVGSINGQPCGPTPTGADWQAQMERSHELQREANRMLVECEGYSSGGNEGSVAVVNVLLDLVFLFVVFGFFVGVWCACVQRQRALNAAHLNNISGQVVGAPVIHVTELKTVQKGDPGYQV